MKRVRAIAMASILALALGGCAGGAGTQGTGGSEGQGQSEQVANEAGSDESVDQSKDEDAAATESTSSEGSAADGYILPDSSEVICHTEDLAGLSDEELFLARNELFARHGVTFDDEELNDYFSSKEWYQKIEPKISDYGMGNLNLIEALNAATIRRIELERGSSHVNELKPSETEMFAAYLAKVQEYQGLYGEGGASAPDEASEHEGLTGLCLVQLVDVDDDGQDELLLAYHDESRATEDNPFGPESYAVEVWAYDEGALRELERMGVESTRAGSSYFLLCKDDTGYTLVDEDTHDVVEKAQLTYRYGLSVSYNAAMGEGYWSSMSDYNLPALEITAETLANLGGVSQ